MESLLRKGTQIFGDSMEGGYLEGAWRLLAAASGAGTCCGCCGWCPVTVTSHCP